MALLNEKVFGMKKKGRKQTSEADGMNWIVLKVVAHGISNIESRSARFDTCKYSNKFVFKVFSIEKREHKQAPKQETETDFGGRWHGLDCPKGCSACLY